MKINYQNQKSFITLFIAVILGAALRLYGLGEIPSSLYWDETAIGVDAQSIAAKGTDMHGNPWYQAIFPSYGDYKQPAYIWLDSLFVKLFHLSPLTVRLPSALAGIALIVIMYQITFNLSRSQKIASLAALIFAILPVDILFSRTGFESHIALLFIAVTVLMWLSSKTKMLLLPLSSFFGAAAVYSYFSARIVIPLLAVVTCIYYFKETTWRWKAAFIGSLIIWILLLIPIFQSPYYAASNQFRLSTQNLSDIGQFAIKSNQLRDQSGNTVLSRLIYHRYTLQASAILINIAKHLDPYYLFIAGDSNLRHGTGQAGILWLGLAPFFISGWIHIFKTKLSLGLWLFSVWIISIIPAAIPLEVPHALRSMNATLIFPIPIAVGMYELLKRKSYIVLFFVGLFITAELGLFLHDYYIHYPKRSASSWQDGYFQLSKFLQTNQQQYDQCQIDYNDGRLFLYLMFTQSTPSTQLTSANNFTFSKVGKCEFKNINPTSLTVSTSRQWIILNSSDNRDFHLKPIHAVLNSSGEPIFTIFTKD